MWRVPSQAIASLSSPESWLISLVQTKFENLSHESRDPGSWFEGEVHFPPAPRFGEALAAVRTEHSNKLRKEAEKFLKAAMTSSNAMDDRVRVNNILMKGADLKPVLNYLSGCQKA